MSVLAPNGLGAASVRARPSAFAGTFAALVFCATVVTASVAVAVSASRVPSSPEQYAVYEMGLVFSLVTVYMSVFVIGQVMSLAVSQRGRESALLRAIGAGPWQIRRMVATEALFTALLALPVGYGLGALVAWGWFGALDAGGMLPDGMSLHIGLGPLFAALGTLVVSSQLGGLIAALRASRTRPSAALSATQVPGGEQAGRVRGTVSLVFLAGAVALTVVAAVGSAENAGDVIPLVLLAYLVATGVAGPWLGRFATRAAAPVLYAVGGVAGELAVAGSRARARRLSAAITPIAMVTAFSLAQFVSLAAAEDVDATALFGTLLYAAFAGLVAANTLVMLTLERLREFSLLRTIGAEKHQIRAVVLAESAITALAGVGAGTAIACALMAPLGARTGTPLSALPMWAWAATLGAGAVLVWAASAAPLGRMFRVRPIDGVARRSA
ncbi:ABC transporter permease [Streptomyces sp. FIT100]|uniref:ABC transporter permease n=1 Tax=Streptomyces sp. FIT100 TaxID=2837956 RepID=UPI0021C86372|nr:ABC transporter permease [Streptomyces sp. FIT100]UUN25597.1 ABC transporter permease [Streptomyces sp. FIT100]